MSTPAHLLAELAHILELPLAFDDSEICVLEIEDTVLTIRCKGDHIILYGALGDYSENDPPLFWRSTMQRNVQLMETLRAAIVLVPDTNNLALMQAIDTSHVDGPTFDDMVRAFRDQTHAINEAWDALSNGDEAESAPLQAYRL